MNDSNRAFPLFSAAAAEGFSADRPAVAQKHNSPYVPASGQGHQELQRTNTSACRRDEVYLFVRRQLVEDHTSPTLEEIAIAMKISKSRARQLVDELVARRRLFRTAGAQRRLRVNEAAANGAGPNVQLPRLPEIRHLPDA